MAAPAGFPLSVQQRRVWALGPSARGVRALAIEGHLDAEALHRALEAMVERHESLRTIFARTPGLRLPLQVIGEQAAVDWDPAAGEGEAALEAAVERLSRGEGFDPAAGPALSARLVVLGPDRHGLVLAVSELCADRASLDLIVAQLGDLYQAARDRREAPEAEPVQYVDFAGWQESLREEEGAADAESFWQAQLSAAHNGAPGTTSSAPEDARPAQVLGVLESALVDRLGDQAAEFVAACWHAVLWRMSQPSQLVVGHVFDGRPLDDLGDAVGAYAQPLPVVTRPQPGMAFAELAEQVREAAGAAREHQGFFGVTGGPQSDELSLPWQLEWRAPGAEPAWGGLALRAVDERTAGHPHELKLVCRSSDGAIELVVSHDPDRVPAARARQLLDSLIAAAADAVERPQVPIDELALAAPHVLRAALGGNGGPAPAVADESFHQAVERQARATPDAAAVEFGELTLTYAELVSAARALAARLAEHRVGPDRRVAICMPRGADYVVALLGVMMAGGAYLPLDADYPVPYLTRIVGGAGALAMIADPAGRSRLAGLDIPVLTLPALNGDSAAPEPAAAAPDNLAYTIYTSGSTGEPKGVEVTHRSLLSLAAVLSETVYAGRPGRLRVSVNAPFTFDASVKQIAMLAHGHTLHVLPADIRLDAHALSDHIEHRRVDVLDCTPSQLRPLLHAIDLHEGREHPRLVLVGGEAVGADLWTALRERRGLDAFNVYGPTETTVDATAASVGDSGPEPTIGRALPGVQALVLDRARQPVPPGNLGELCIGGWGVARGYTGGEPAGGDGFVDHPDPDRAGERLFCTGDLVRERADGRLDYLGRRDRQVKLRGFRIGLGEVEAALARHPGVAEVAVVDVTTRAGSRRLCAFVVAGGDEAQIVDGVRAHAESELPEHMRPASVELCDRLPVTAHGKVDLAALRERALERLEAGGEYVAPRSDPERLLAEIWAAALEIERVGVNDDFFDLGGDSILQIVVVARAKERGLDLTPRDLFENPTVAELAAVAA